MEDLLLIVPPIIKKVRPKSRQSMKVHEVHQSMNNHRLCFQKTRFQKTPQRRLTCSVSTRLRVTVVTFVGNTPGFLNFKTLYQAKSGLIETERTPGYLHLINLYESD